MPITLRQTSRDTTLQSHFLPAHTTVVICPWAINTSTHLWGPDARHFVPERWLAPGAEGAPEGVPAAPRVKLGGTLFERMSNAARGAAKDDADTAPQDPLDIPRFLHRQNNQ